MNGKSKFRIDTLWKLLGLVERNVIRNYEAIGDIYFQEPAEMRYDCPADSGEWKKICLNVDVGG